MLPVSPAEGHSVAESALLHVHGKRRATDPAAGPVQISYVPGVLRRLSAVAVAGAAAAAALVIARCAAWLVHASLLAAMSSRGELWWAGGPERRLHARPDGCAEDKREGRGGSDARQRLPPPPPSGTRARSRAAIPALQARGTLAAWCCAKQRPRAHAGASADCQLAKAADAAPGWLQASVVVGLHVRPPARTTTRERVASAPAAALHTREAGMRRVHAYMQMPAAAPAAQHAGRQQHRAVMRHASCTLRRCSERGGLTLSAASERLMRAADEWRCARGVHQGRG